MKSTESPERVPQQQMQREFRLSTGVKRLLSMTGVQSFAESLSDEAAWIRQQLAADHSTIYGGATSSNGAASGDAAMRDMIAGDVTNNILPPKKSGPGLMTTALLAGATGVGGALLWDKLDADPTPTPAVEQPEFTDTDTRTDVRFPD